MSDIERIEIKVDDVDRMIDELRRHRRPAIAIHPLPNSAATPAEREKQLHDLARMLSFVVERPIMVFVVGAPLRLAHVVVMDLDGPESRATCQAIGINPDDYRPTISVTPNTPELPSPTQFKPRRMQ